MHMDMEMLEAIKALLAEQEARMDTKLAEMEQRLDKKLSEAEQRIAKSTVALMDIQFMGQFKALAEGQEDILRRMPNEDDMDIIDGRLHDLEADVALLKKAQ